MMKMKMMMMMMMNSSHGHARKTRVDQKLLLRLLERKILASTQRPRLPLGLRICICQKPRFHIESFYTTGHLPAARSEKNNQRGFHAAFGPAVRQARLEAKIPRAC